MKEQSNQRKKLLYILSENIKNYRKNKNISQEELAELCGLHRTYIGSVERAERNVTLKTLVAISYALGISVPNLLTRNRKFH